MLSGRELALDQNQHATGWVNERIVYTHGIGLAMVPVNEVANEGQPRLFIGNLPPVSTAAPRRSRSRASTSASGRRTTSSSAPSQTEFDYPTRRGTPAADVPDDELDGQDRHQARHDPDRGSCSPFVSATWTCSSATR